MSSAMIASQIGAADFEEYWASKWTWQILKDLLNSMGSIWISKEIVTRNSFSFL